MTMDIYCGFCNKIATMNFSLYCEAQIQCIMCLRLVLQFVPQIATILLLSHSLLFFSSFFYKYMVVIYVFLLLFMYL